MGNIPLPNAKLQSCSPSAMNTHIQVQKQVYADDSGSYKAKYIFTLKHTQHIYWLKY